MTHPDRYTDPPTPVPPAKFARGFFFGLALALVFWLVLALAIVAFS